MCACLWWEIAGKNLRMSWINQCHLWVICKRWVWKFLIFEGLENFSIAQVTFFKVIIIIIMIGPVDVWLNSKIKISVVVKVCAIQSGSNSSSFLIFFMNQNFSLKIEKKIIPLILQFKWIFTLFLNRKTSENRLSPSLPSVTTLD